MNKIAFCILFMVAVFSSSACYSQNIPDSTRIYRVETNDGNTFIGSIVTEDSIRLVLKTSNLGELKILQNDIKSKTEIKNATIIGGQYYLPNPQSSRYFWAPNGYGLKAGEAYYQNIWVLYNQFSAGITNYFSVGAGMVPLFLFEGTPTPFWIVPKFSIPVIKDKFNIGTGAFLGTLLGEDSGLFGLLYGTTTLGDRDNNISFGLAYGFAEGEWMKVPVINLSGMFRVSPKSYIVTENYAITSEGELTVIFSIGGRSIIRKVGLDYSLWIPFASETEGFIAIPFLGITVPIGASKKPKSTNQYLY